MTEKLTASFLESLKPAGRDRIVFDRLLSGFAVRVTPTGTKLFIVQAWAGGRVHRVTIGAFPAMALADARNEARIMLADLRAGRDPKAERSIRLKAINTGEMTVDQLADKWLSDYVRPKLKPRTVFDYERLLRQHILPALGHLSVAGVSRDDITRLHVSMAKTPRRANYTVSTVRALMSFACDLKLRPPLDNPCRKLKMYRERARERFLSETEIAAAAEAIGKAEREGKVGRMARQGCGWRSLPGRAAARSPPRSGRISTGRAA